MRWLYRHSKSGSQSTFLTSECPGSSRPTRPVRVSHHPPPVRPSTTTPCYGPADFSDTQPALDPLSAPSAESHVGSHSGWTAAVVDGHWWKWKPAAEPSVDGCGRPRTRAWRSTDQAGDFAFKGRRPRSIQPSRPPTHRLARCPTMSTSSAQLSPGGELDRHRECDRVGWGAVLVELLFQGITDSQAGLIRLAV